MLDFYFWLVGIVSSPIPKGCEFVDTHECGPYACSIFERRPFAPTNITWLLEFLVGPSKPHLRRAGLGCLFVLRPPARNAYCLDGITALSSLRRRSSCSRHRLEGEIKHFPLCLYRCFLLPNLKFPQRGGSSSALDFDQVVKLSELIRSICPV